MHNGEHTRSASEAPGSRPLDLERLRAETPACKERIHLNNAGASLMPRPVLAAVQEHLELESRLGGYEAAEARRDLVDSTYGAVAELLGARPHNIALTENATVSTIQALSSIPFERGDRILTTTEDYVSTQLELLALRKRFGVEIVRAPNLPEGGVDPNAVVQLIRRHRPRLVCAVHVPTSSGLVQDIAAVGAACREAEVLYLVDACQSVGQLSIAVEQIGCDFLSATSRKFLRGPRGAGFLFVSERVLSGGLEPLFIDLRGADWVAPDHYRPVADAKRFELWETAWALALGTGVAARYALSVGISAIEVRVRHLADRLRRGLAEIDGVRVLDRGSDLCAIVTVSVEGWRPGELVAALRRRQINTSEQIRSFAVIDFDAKGVTGALRLSPHYFNTEAEVDQAVLAISELASERGSAGR